MRLRSCRRKSHCRRRSLTPSAFFFSRELGKQKSWGCDGPRSTSLESSDSPSRENEGGRQDGRAAHLSIRARPSNPFDATRSVKRGKLFVFPAARGEGHAIGLRRAFTKICANANLEGLRIHDLRHSFASFAVADGASLFLIGKLLGHASARTTERYAHLSNNPLQDAADRIGRRIIEATANVNADGPATPATRSQHRRSSLS